MTREHLTTVKAKCHCGEPASTLRRCKCGEVIARCGAHDRDMDQQLKDHCK